MERLPGQIVHYYRANSIEPDDKVITLSILIYNLIERPKSLKGINIEERQSSDFIFTPNDSPVSKEFPSSLDDLDGLKLQIPIEHVVETGSDSD